MAYQKWTDLLVASTVGGTSFGTFTTAKTVIPTNALKTLPADFFEIGRVLEILRRLGIGCSVAEYNSAIQQIENLRYE